MSTERNLIRQEIKARQQFIRGTVLRDPELRLVDGTNQMWVTDVQVLGKRPLFNVPIKTANRGIFFAELGQIVLLARNLQGKFEIIGPGDRNIVEKVVKTYAVTGANTATANQGFSVIVDPFEFYQGAQAMKGNPNVTFTTSTITRSGGSFLDDGFPQSGTLRVANSPNGDNDGTFTLTAAIALVLTVSGTPFVAGGPFPQVAVAMNGTSRWNDSVTPFPSKRLVDQDGNVVSP